MKNQEYRNIITNETVNKEDAEEYMLEKLGLSIEAKGNNGEMTSEQVEFLTTFEEWYFSDNWILEEIEDEDKTDLEKALYIEERIYQDNLEKKWGLV